MEVGIAQPGAVMEMARGGGSASPAHTALPQGLSVPLLRRISAGVLNAHWTPWGCFTRGSYKGPSTDSAPGWASGAASCLFPLLWAGEQGSLCSPSR